jgi:PleD family two-component response regulator
MIRDNLSILVVDDMKFSCEFVRRALIKEGYQSIELVNNAPDALKLLQIKSFDVILADWLMPEMDGLELSRKIRQLDEEKQHYTGIVLLTAKDDIDSIRVAFEEGVDDYIIKPPNQVELAARVYSAGRVARMQNDLLVTTQTLRERFETQCKVDNITGLDRLQDTEKRLAELIQHTESRGGMTCCAILKVNDYASYLEKYGKSVQEQLLASIANRVSRLIRPMDLLGHTDKEAFLIAMYHQNPDDARCRNFRRILHDINHRSFKTSSGFINIQCAMAMTQVSQNDIDKDVKSIISITEKKLIKSVAMGFEDVAT